MTDATYVHYKKHVIHIEPDYNVDWDEIDPRTTCDNLGKLVLFHRRHPVPNETSLRSEDYDSWAEVRDAIEQEYDVAVILPVYAYDHTGFYISTKVEPFWWHYSWDGGPLGFIFATKEDVRKWYQVKRVTADVRAKVVKELTGEVDALNYAMNATFFSYDVFDEMDWETILDGGRLASSEEEAIEAGKEYIDRRLLLGW